MFKSLSASNSAGLFIWKV